MAIFCVPKFAAEKIKNIMSSGKFDIKKLYNMSSKERNEFFTKHTDSDIGKLLNTKFEEAMISKQKTAMQDFVNSIISPKEKTKPVYKSMIDKINNLDEVGVLNPKAENVFLQDLVTEKLGINVSAAEVAKISERAAKIQEAQKKLGDDLGNPEKMQENIDFFEAKKEMDDYLLSLTPASNLRILTGTIGRGMMLFSIKSPLLNIGSNIEVGLTEAMSRRIANLNIRGADNKLSIDYIKMVNKIYQKTGFDLSRMTSLKDTGASGERVLGETIHAKGPGGIRKAGQFVEDIVFKQLMGAPDVAFSSAHFADSVNLNAMKLAKGDAVKGRKLMLDSMKLEPTTVEGEIIRAQGILDAQKATWTNKSWASRVSEGIRKVINDVSGDLRLGDWFLPFVKTPANVIATGMDYAGMGIPKALVKTVQAIKAGELKDPEFIKSVSRDLVRSGIGLTGAFIITQQLKDEDFVGAYDPARYQIEKLRNTNYNAVRIGDKWISLDWFGPLSVPIAGMMYARKYGTTPGEKTFQYALGSGGVFQQFWNLPGVSDTYDVVKSEIYKKNQTLDEMTTEALDYALSQAYSRLVPSFLTDIAKATDTKERETGGTVIGQIKAKIPGVRETLPEKKTIFGETIETEPAWSSILFGARVKTSKETDIIKEISDISTSTGKGITFTDWDKSISKTLAQFKQKRGVKNYEKAKIQYGQELQRLLKQTFKSKEYKRASDDEKLKIINGLDSIAIDNIFDRYHFKYKKEK